MTRYSIAFFKVLLLLLLLLLLLFKHAENQMHAYNVIYSSHITPSLEIQNSSASKHNSKRLNVSPTSPNL